jgi:hypothetical protein
VAIANAFIQSTLNAEKKDHKIGAEDAMKISKKLAQLVVGQCMIGIVEPEEDREFVVHEAVRFLRQIGITSFGFDGDCGTMGISQFKLNLSKFVYYNTKCTTTVHSGFINSVILSCNAGTSEEAEAPGMTSLMVNNDNWKEIAGIVRSNATPARAEIMKDLRSTALSVSDLNNIRRAAIVHLELAMSIFANTSELSPPGSDEGLVLLEKIYEFTTKQSPEMRPKMTLFHTMYAAIQKDIAAPAHGPTSQQAK